MTRRLLALLSFEVRKLAARRLPLVAAALIVAVALLAPWAGHVVDTASSLAQGRPRAVDAFANGWTALASGVSTTRLFLMIAVLVLAGSSVAEEWAQGTIKALLVRPVRRVELLLAKTAAVWLFAAGVLLVAVLASGLGGEVTQGLYDVVDPEYTTRVKHTFGSMLGYTALATALTLPPLLALTTLGLLCSTVFDHPGHATGAAVGALFVISGATGLMDDDARHLVFVTHLVLPFDVLDGLAKQFSGVIQDLAPEAALRAVAVSLAWAAGLFAAAAALLERRDIGG